MHLVLCYETAEKSNNKKKAKITEFKLLTLFFYQIIFSDCVSEFLLSQPSYSITFMLKNN